jgi:uncharacterized membrane protein
MTEQNENVERVTALREDEAAVAPWDTPPSPERETIGRREAAAPSPWGAESHRRAAPFAGPPATGRADRAVPSVAAIGGHPIHPMVVPLPIGALALTAASDIAYAATGDRFFARASRALTGVGIGTGLLAGLLGATDFLGRRRIREHPEAWLHAGGNLAVVGLSTVSFLVRGRRRGRSVAPIGLVLSSTTAALLLITGWLGGELSYRHRIGVIPRSGR